MAGNRERNSASRSAANSRPESSSSTSSGYYGPSFSAEALEGEPTNTPSAAKAALRLHYLRHGRSRALTKTSSSQALFSAVTPRASTEWSSWTMACRCATSRTIDVGHHLTRLPAHIADPRVPQPVVLHHAHVSAYLLAFRLSLRPPPNRVLCHEPPANGVQRLCARYLRNSMGWICWRQRQHGVGVRRECHSVREVGRELQIIRGGMSGNQCANAGVVIRRAVAEISHVAVRLSRQCAAVIAPYGRKSRLRQFSRPRHSRPHRRVPARLLWDYSLPRSASCSEQRLAPRYAVR